MSPEPSNPEDASKAVLPGMREPPGRLGDIVRRLKQAPSTPARLDSAAGETESA